MTGNSSEDFGKYIFSRLLFIPEGGFPNSVMLLLRAMLLQAVGFIPETLRTRAMEFITDPPRVPSNLFPDIPVTVWENASYREHELSLLKNNRDVHNLASWIEKENGNKQWLKDFLQPELLKRYNGREAGQIPRLAAGFAALEAREYRRFAKTWIEQLSEDIAALRPESPMPLEVLNHGVRSVSMPDDKEL